MNNENLFLIRTGSPFYKKKIALHWNLFYFLLLFHESDFVYREGVALSQDQHKIQIA